MGLLSTSVISFVVIAIIVQIRTLVYCFNIETRGNLLFKIAKERNTYFGFSVAQHIDPLNGPVILVGAPLGNNKQPGTNHSGALFKCYVKYDNIHDDCEQVITDGKRQAGGGYKFQTFDYETENDAASDSNLLPPGKDEIKDGQWMGVTVKTQKSTGLVVVCGHRYIYSESIQYHHYGLGLCYVLTPSLTLDQELLFCKGKPMEKLHQQFGLCQTGISLDIIDTGLVVVGSPGPFTWRGTIFSKQIGGTFLGRDTTTYQGPLNDQPEPIDKYSYMGMSVAGGRFFRSNYTYASGAPRSKYNGQVFLLERISHNAEMNITTVLTGVQFGSSFGYELLAVDIDQDGIDELLVSAPFYYANGVGGAVYVYKGLIEGLTSVNKPVQVLTGVEESRFGFALAAMGDINRDGYFDVAIGAPYDKTGAVYIYLGTKTGLSKEPSQVIRNEKLQTFGHSLSAGYDMDNNGYPDVVVGAYTSDTVILYKTRPIIDIRIDVESEEIYSVNVTKKGCSTNSTSQKTCFGLKLCVTLLNSNKPVMLTRDLREELSRAAPIPRASYLGDKKALKNILIHGGVKNCDDEVTVYIEDGANVDISTPIKFVVNYTVLNDIYNSPILNKTSVKHFQANFQKDCGSDDVCSSNLALSLDTSLEKLPSRDVPTYELNLDSNEFFLNVTVHNSGESAYETNLYVNHSNCFSYVALEKHSSPTVTCHTDLNKTQIECSLGNPIVANKSIILSFRFETIHSKWERESFHAFINTTSNDTLQFAKKSELFIEAKKIADIQLRGKTKPPSVHYGGEIKGESAIRSLKEIGPAIYHEYEIINLGKWHVPDITLRIEWPYQVRAQAGGAEGKWLLYVTEPLKVDASNGSVLCAWSAPGAVNPLRLGGGAGGRRRRAAEALPLEAAREGERRVVTMDCATARCVAVTCRIEQLARNNHVTVRVQSRLWNATLMEDYNGVDSVVVRSRAVFSIADEKTALKGGTNWYEQETNAIPTNIPPKEPLNIWILIGSILAGLILLVICIIILYKIGFFKRNRVKDQTLSGNLIKSENESLIEDKS